MYSCTFVALDCIFNFLCFFKDKEKLEIRKLNDPPSAEVVQGMIRYARNMIEEFRRAKHYKYILCLALSQSCCFWLVL